MGDCRDMKYLFRNMGKLLHDRLTIFAQRNNFYGVEHCLRWARVSPESGQIVCAGKGESQMVKISICTTGCTYLTSKFLIKHTLARELLPFCFLESFGRIFYNKDEEISKGGGVR